MNRIQVNNYHNKYFTFYLSQINWLILTFKLWDIHLLQIYLSKTLTILDDETNIYEYENTIMVVDSNSNNDNNNSTTNTTN